MNDAVEGKHGRGVHEPLYQLCEEALESPALLLCHVGQAIQVGDQRAYFLGVFPLLAGSFEEG